MNISTVIQKHETKLQSSIDANTCAVVGLLECLSNIGGRAEVKINKFVKELRSNGEADTSSL